VERRRQLRRGICVTCYSFPEIRAAYCLRRKAGPAVTMAGDRLPPSPTEAPPGSAEKVAALEVRAAGHYCLWHPQDGPAALSLAAEAAQIAASRGLAAVLMVPRPPHEFRLGS
jgi:hypothetical protein